jgi:hypothetical protein
MTKGAKNKMAGAAATASGLDLNKFSVIQFSDHSPNGILLSNH